MRGIELFNICIIYAST